MKTTLYSWYHQEERSRYKFRQTTNVENHLKSKNELNCETPASEIQQKQKNYGENFEKILTTEINQIKTVQKELKCSKEVMKESSDGSIEAPRRKNTNKLE